MKLLIKNIDVVTSTNDNMFLKNAYIAVTDDIITKVTVNEGDIETFIPDKIIDGKKFLAMPGLINAHTHTPMTILRNYADDLALEDWLFNHIFPAESKLTSDDVYWGSMLGIAEMIRGGTTAFADMYYFVERTCGAVKESGIRANISKSAFPFEFDSDGLKFLDERNKYIEFHNEWNDSSEGRIKTYVMVHSPYIYDMKSMEDSARFAKEMNTGIQIHILETAKELIDTTNKYGKDGAMACFDAGLYDVPVIAAHCVHLSSENIKMFAKNRVNVVHNPTSNLKLGSGIAPVPQMMESGVNVALGTDGTASNNNLNMFEELHLAALIHKGAAQNPLLVNANDAIRMATINGAKALGIEKEVGTIEVGKKADIVLIDMDKIHLTPYNDAVSSIAYSVQASDVDTVIINGKIVMEKCEIKTIDIEKAKYEVSKIIERIR
jgi:5-methylthioadenosine/S-adenosylhomocysteine deaminase